MRSRLAVFLALLQGAFYVLTGVWASPPAQIRSGQRNLIYVSSDVISPIYLLDAGAEILLASLWIVARARGSDPR